MDVRCVGKNLKVTKEMKDHVEDKISRLGKFAPRTVQAHVVLGKEKYIYYAHVTVQGKNLQAYGEGKQKENLFAAVDQAVERVSKQLKKFRDKIKDHHKEHGENAQPPKVKTARQIMRREKSAGPSIVEMPSYAPKPMSIEEASMQLAIGKEPFLVFSNAATSKPSVIFKRPDGNHGLIQPKF